MRIAIDATSLLDTRTGVGNFVAALLDGLVRRDDLEVTAFPVSLRGRSRLGDEVPAGVRVVAPPLPAAVARAGWSRFDAPRIDLAIGRHDVVHGPNFVVPPSRAARIATVHDLTSVHHPELCNRHTLAYPALIRRAAERGAWIHTVSASVRAEVLELFPADPDRVVAVANGFTPMTHGDLERGRELAGHEPFALAVGTVEPRKDLPGLVRAIDRLADGGTRIPLVHVGPDGWGAPALAAAVEEMRHPELFTRLGRLSDADLAAVYRAARLFVYPSVYEGFGLPVLEAMSVDVPVVATAVPAIVEVAGDAAELVPVHDVDALATAIVALWHDEQRRATLVAAGRQRAAAFSWDTCVDGLVELYRRAVADADQR